jgi:hypothetical protein
VSSQDPDIAALAARLGLRSFRYRSFGNRPVGTALPDPAPAATPAEPPPGTPPQAMVAEALPAVVPRVAPPAAVPLAAMPLAPPPPAPAPAIAFPLITAALGRAMPEPAAATEATLAFVGLRARLAQGR